MDYFARTNETDKQLMSKHLTHVADLSEGFSDYKSLSRLVGILHDLGKATSAFQNYLLNGGERGSVVHSLQGAFFADDCIDANGDASRILAKEIVSMAIVAHHGALHDGVSPDGEVVFFQKLADKENEKYHYQEVKQNSSRVFAQLEFDDNTCDIEALFNSAIEDVRAIMSSIGKAYKTLESAQFAIGLFVKYIYSCLIDADRLDAYLFDIGKQYEPIVMDWDNLINIFEEKIQQFSTESKIAAIRQTISEKCKEAAGKETGIYQLSVPTGGGKTLSSMRYALHHCKRKNKRRIIYVIPYLSIIEQTAAEFRKIFDLQDENDIILEHHSGIVMPDDEKEREIRKLASSRWDKPIIITTMVQFLETIMSARGSDLRKFHQMSNSIIIFDEIQSLPVKTIHLFNETVSFLAKICNTTILLCTATQPLLDKTDRKNLLLEDTPELISCDKMFDEIKRTVIVAVEERDPEAFADFIEEKARKNSDCLAIVNTRKTAREVFDRLKGISDFEVYHLSTSMCSVHRAETITQIKKALESKRRIICVTTQLIEAGVDISFSCVVRASAGLDSVAQAAGRCNRNGESVKPKEVYIIPIKGENLDMLADIKSGKDITGRLIRENESADMLNPDIMEQFYKYYYFNRGNIMDYPVDTGSIYDMLSCNNTGMGNYRNRTGRYCQSIIAQAFHTAAEEFCVIDKKTESVVVLYGEAEKLKDDYNKQPKGIITKEKLNIIRKLEKFNVSLYHWEIGELTGAIDVLDEETGIKILDKFHYSRETGVVLETDPSDYIV